MSEEIKTALKTYDIEKVNIYLSYLKFLKNEKDKHGNNKNPWISYVKNEEFINAFRLVHQQGLFIDGDSVTLAFRKKLITVYDYHAYKNKVLISYPETKFDFGVIREGDSYSFRKDSGVVSYTHIIADRFKGVKNIVGAYGIIKNKSGEFLEIIDIDDINKMKNSSTMTSIWLNWYDRMVLKSVIKRICNVHFYDLIKDIDKIDNESSDPELAGIDELLQKEINDATESEQLTSIYKKYINDVKDVESFIKLLGEKKHEILGE